MDAPLFTSGAVQLLWPEPEIGTPGAVALGASALAVVVITTVVVVAAVVVAVVVVAGVVVAGVVVAVVVVVCCGDFPDCYHSWSGLQRL